MGSLMGHLAPGTFFILFALWWIYSIFRKYYTAKYDPKSNRYENTATFLSQRWPNIPLEGYLKLLASITGVIGETITGFKWVDNQWKFANVIPNGSHIIMFLFFVVNAIADLATFYKGRHLPKDLDYVFATVAAMCECYLFANHLHGRNNLDVKLHTCLVFVILLCVISSLAEMLGNRHDVRFGLFRSCSYLWQGTWLLQTGIILYPPKGFPSWDHESMRTSMIMDLMFMGHLMSSILVIVLIGSCIYIRKKKSCDSKGKWKNASTEYHALVSAHDVDEDSNCVKTPFS